MVWWDPGTILRKPDWLREKRGPDVHPGIRWIPLITFLQISADMVASDNSTRRPRPQLLQRDPYAWQAILQVPGWTDGKSARLGPELAATELSSGIASESFVWFADLGKRDQQTKEVAAEMGGGVAGAVIDHLFGSASKTTRPPWWPASGPRSMIQSAAAITSRLCSITTSVEPLSTRRSSNAMRRAVSATCRPVVVRREQWGVRAFRGGWRV